MQRTENAHVLNGDIVDIILQELAPPDGEWERVGCDDARPKEDLYAASLVCRSWYSLSRRHIFRNILYSFTPGEIDPSWETLDTGRWRRVRRERSYGNEWVCLNEPCKTLLNLGEFLRDYPERAAQIQRLSLRCYPHDVRLEARSPARRATRYYDRPAQLIPPSLLFSILRALPCLHTLRLRDIFLQTTDTEPVPESPDTPLIPLKQLSISYPYAGTYLDHHTIPPLLPVLSRWVKTKALQIAAPGMKVTRADVGNILFAQLDTLALHHVPYTTRLPRHFLGLNVRNLVLILSTSAELPTYNKYLRDMGHNLKHLRVHSGNTDGQYTFDISPCTNLETLAMEFPETLWDRPGDTWQLIASVASSMMGLEKLREFKIHLRMPPIEIYDDDLAELDRHSQCPRMNARLVACARRLNLRSLFVVYHTSPEAREDPYDWPRALLRKIFSVVDEHKLLRIKKGTKGGSWLIDPDATGPLPRESYHWW